MMVVARLYWARANPVPKKRLDCLRSFNVEWLDFVPEKQEINLELIAYSQWCWDGIPEFFYSVKQGAD
jgi:hypothetical protein